MRTVFTTEPKMEFRMASFALSNPCKTAERGPWIYWKTAKGARIRSSRATSTLLYRRSVRGTARMNRMAAQGASHHQSQPQCLIEPMFHHSLLTFGCCFRNGRNQGDRQSIGDKPGKKQERDRHSFQLSVHRGGSSHCDSGDGQTLGNDDWFHRIRE